MASNTNHRRRRNTKAAVTTGIASAGFVGIATWGIGTVSAGEAQVLLEAMLPTSRFLCSAVATASATILALMLTLLGMAVNVAKDFDRAFYQRIRQVAFYDMITFVVAIVFLTVHCLPITKSDDIPAWWYSTAYYVILLLSAALTGGITLIAVMLYTALGDLMDAVCSVNDECEDY